jgi:histone H2B
MAPKTAEEQKAGKSKA